MGGDDDALHRTFTVMRDSAGLRARVASVGGEIVMAFIAMVMFVALFAFGQSYFGWADPNGHIQLALFSAFLFGIICGFRVKD